MCAFRQMGRQTCLTLWMVACNRAPRSWGKKKAICPASKEELWRCESRISWVDAAARANTADMPKAEWAPWGKTPLRVFEDNEEHFLQPKSQRTFTCFLFFSWKYLANPILALLQLSRGFHFSREVGMREAIALVLLRQLHIELEIVPTILLQINGFHGSLKKPSQSLVHFSESNMNKTSYVTVLHQIPLDLWQGYLQEGVHQLNIWSVHCSLKILWDLASRMWEHIPLPTAKTQEAQASIDDTWRKHPKHLLLTVTATSDCLQQFLRFGGWCGIAYLPQTLPVPTELGKTTGTSDPIRQVQTNPALHDGFPPASARGRVQGQYTPGNPIHRIQDFEALALGKTIKESQQLVPLFATSSTFERWRNSLQLVPLFGFMKKPQQLPTHATSPWCASSST